jgi:hypothetical protein
MTATAAAAAVHVHGVELLLRRLLCNAVPLLLLLLLWLFLKMVTFPPPVESKLKTLPLDFAVRVRAWLFLCKLLGYSVIITSARRTAAEQLALHKQDKRNPAPSATNTHLLGIAVDVNFLKAGTIVLRKATEKSLWLNSGVVRAAQLCGISWGGNFSNYYDPVHFQLAS